MMIPSYNNKGCAAFHSRRESITGESPTSFAEEDTTMFYSGFERTRLQAEVKFGFKVLTLAWWRSVEIGVPERWCHPHHLTKVQNYETRRQ
ncbi:hypothetical protein TNCV_3738311 [Trichonephila clavipes]|nr:hypothetical protein TNCV_3738311 [Trichonephila clavipes]